jgi:hypothetical protein
MASTSVARKYTNISFDDIRAHLVEIVKAKEGALADMGDSSFGKTMIELFSGFGDLAANWTEAAFGNVFLETATSKPAVYAGARSIGYSVRRPVPAKCSIGIQVTSIREHGTLKVFIPKGTVFTMSGATLTSMDDMEFIYDYDADADQTGLMELSRGLNVLAEGQFRTEVLISNGRQNQEFHINDASFSDYFGDSDPNFSDDGNMAHRPACFTRVTSDATLMDNIDPDIVIDDKLYWRISRRGLEDPGLDTKSTAGLEFSTEQGNYSTNYTALIETANDGSVAIRFGDGLKGAIPFGNIEVTYFSTNGESGNMLGVFGTALSTTGGNITITTKDGQETDVTLNDLNICLVTDIRGGLDIESIESIRNNASVIYNTLDRLVTREAYKVFLRRYADVKYASAYGEDVLNTKLRNGGINVKYMNQVRFTVLKDLYRKKDGKYYPTTEDEYMLAGYKVNGLMYNWLYDFQDPNKESVVEDGAAIIDGIRGELDATVEKALVAAGIETPSDEQIAAISAELMKLVNKHVPPIVLDDSVFSAFLTPMDFVVEGSELHNIMLALNRRGMLTVGDGFHNYVYPSVHNMEIKMDVVLYKGNNFTDIRERIKNVVYRYLKENTEFCTPIFRSKIASLVHSMKEVAGVDVYFQPADSAFAELDLENYPWMGDSTATFCDPGTTAFTGMSFTLQGSYKGGPRVSDVFTMRDQGKIQTQIAEYYAQYVKPYVGTRTIDGCGNLKVENSITDKLIDRFVAYIWERVMQEIYAPIMEALDNEYNSGGTDTLRYRAIRDSIKTWDMGKDSLKFKNISGITDMVEINGVTLFDYMRYGMDYIKLVRRVLGAKSTETLINSDTGNITEYSNDNEIVQFTIPNELINLTVAQSSSLLTGTGSSV